MNCPHCNTEIDPGAVFCGNCGQALSPQPIAQQQIIGQATAPSPTPFGQVTQPTQTAAPASSAPPFQPAAISSAQVGTVQTSPSVFSPQPAGVTNAPMTGGFNNMPAYASPIAMQKKGDGLATASLVLGILGLIGWIVAIVGFIMGILALIFGTLSLKSSKRGFAIAGTILSIPVIGASIFSAVIGYQNYQKKHDTTKSSTSSNKTAVVKNADEQTVSTSCYDIQLPKALKITQSPDNCSISGLDEVAGSFYTVVGLTVDQSTLDDLKTASRPDILNFLKSSPGSSIASEEQTTFRGDKAYHYVLKSAEGDQGNAIYVAHKSSTDNLFIFLRIEDNGEAGLDGLEQGLAWK